MKQSVTTYWSWFLKGSGGKPGYRRIVNKWFIFHLLIGLVITLVVGLKLSDCANFISLAMTSFLLSNVILLKRIHMLLQSKEIERLSKYHKGGFVEYVYTFHTSTLIIFIAFVLWILAGLQLFEIRDFEVYFGINVLLFTIFSLSIREFWHIIVGIQTLLIIQKKIKQTCLI